jgi:hypothetical protein
MMRPLCFLINASAINTPSNASIASATPSKQQQRADQEQKEALHANDCKPNDRSDTPHDRSERDMKVENELYCKQADERKPPAMRQSSCARSRYEARGGRGQQDSERDSLTP